MENNLDSETVSAFVVSEKSKGKRPKWRGRVTPKIVDGKLYFEVALWEQEE